MNLLDRYAQFKIAKSFNRPDVKGVVSVRDYSFDIRLVNGELYANGLSLADFFAEAMLSLDEEISYEEAIYQWLSEMSKFQVA
ncbi:hypothetical protein [Mucilaginibacter flavus]|uniref:hypothetical protein n=1 Tax=Mucilaginibacter flavus TaxID=931504 RepID=UPI0025B59661|nr:hypothetical protein [Mucilaginibacter flavus]MDN3581948.1 hypothetical protein [Mucilaginibacter flavus]